MSVTEMAAALGYNPVALATAIDNCPPKLLSQYLRNLETAARAAR